MAEVVRGSNGSVSSWVLASQAFLGGWLAGGAGIMVGHPFDTIKTLQQSHKLSHQPSPGAISTLRSVLSGYGLSGLYRGLAYPLYTYGLVNAAFFTAAEHTRSFLFAHGYAKERLSYGQVFVVGCAGGVAQLGVVCPSELVKIKLQTQLQTGQRLYKGPWDCTLKLVRQNGLSSLYKGMASCWIRDIYGWGVYLVMYEYNRDLLMAKGYNYIPAELMAGGLAGAVSWCLVTPVDVVKTRIQASENKARFIPTVKSLYREGGVRVFTRGMLVSSLRGFPSNGVTLFGFAECMRWFDRYNKSTYDTI